MQVWRIASDTPDYLADDLSGAGAKAGVRRRAEAAAGGKRVHFDRLEWHIIQDTATSTAALIQGEMDWFEQPTPENQLLLRRNRNVRVDIADPLGNIGSFRFNHLHPPFDNVKARQALAASLSQQDYMMAFVGDAEVGAGANIGAGTVTCNFDGKQKHRTLIGEEAFIGSGTMLVAPVRVGRGAVIGAGSVVTRDIPDETLAYGVPARERGKIVGSG